MAESAHALGGSCCSADRRERRKKRGGEARGGRGNKEKFIAVVCTTFFGWRSAAKTGEVVEQVFLGDDKLRDVLRHKETQLVGDHASHHKSHAQVGEAVMPRGAVCGRRLDGDLGHLCYLFLVFFLLGSLSEH